MKKHLFRKISDPISLASGDFQEDWHFFSEVRFLSDQKCDKVMGLKFMGKLSDLKKSVSARRKKRYVFFLVKFCGLPVRTFLQPESSAFIQSKKSDNSEPYGSTLLFFLQEILQLGVSSRTGLVATSSYSFVRRNIEFFSSEVSWNVLVTSNAA